MRRLGVPRRLDLGDRGREPGQRRHRAGRLPARRSRRGRRQRSTCSTRRATSWSTSPAASPSAWRSARCSSRCFRRLVGDDIVGVVLVARRGLPRLPAGRGDRRLGRARRGRRRADRRPPLAGALDAARRGCAATRSGRCSSSCSTRCCSCSSGSSCRRSWRSRTAPPLELVGLGRAGQRRRSSARACCGSNTTPYVIRALDRRPSQRRAPHRAGASGSSAAGRGLRGSVSLAAALALPAGLPRARPADLPDAVRDLRHARRPGADAAVADPRGSGSRTTARGEREELLARREATAGGDRAPRAPARGGLDARRHRRADAARSTASGPPAAPARRRARRRRGGGRPRRALGHLPADGPRGARRPAPARRSSCATRARSPTRCCTRSSASSTSRTSGSRSERRYARRYCSTASTRRWSCRRRLEPSFEKMLVTWRSTARS